MLYFNSLWNLADGFMAQIFCLVAEYLVFAFLDVDFQDLHQLTAAELPKLQPSQQCLGERAAHWLCLQDAAWLAFQDRQIVLQAQDILVLSIATRVCSNLGTICID